MRRWAPRPSRSPSTTTPCASIQAVSASGATPDTSSAPSTRRPRARTSPISAATQRQARQTCVADIKRVSNVARLQGQCRQSGAAGAGAIGQVERAFDAGAADPHAGKTDRPRLHRRRQAQQEVAQKSCTQDRRGRISECREFAARGVRDDLGLSIEQGRRVETQDALFIRHSMAVTGVRNRNALCITSCRETSATRQSRVNEATTGTDFVRGGRVTRRTVGHDGRAISPRLIPAPATRFPAAHAPRLPRRHWSHDTGPESRARPPAAARWRGRCRSSDPAPRSTCFRVTHRRYRYTASSAMPSSQFPRRSADRTRSGSPASCRAAGRGGTSGETRRPPADAPPRYRIIRLNHSIVVSAVFGRPSGCAAARRRIVRMCSGV